MTLIERVREAIIHASTPTDKAVAAIETMQEPTKAMIETGEVSIRCGFGARYVWLDMIKKGLK